MSKRIDLTPFIGSGFDLEVKPSIKGIGSIGDKWQPARYEKRTLIYLGGVRPRYQKPQVLDDYSKVLVDGLVWEVELVTPIRDEGICIDCEVMCSSVVLSALRGKTWLGSRITSIKFIGLEKGYEEQANEWNVPII